MEGKPEKVDKPKAAKKPAADGKVVDPAIQYKRKECEDLLKRKFFYIQSFEIYGGVAGLYDYGPLGSALKANVEQLWRQFFILEEDMLELTCSCITLSEVLKTSGHVEKFADFMVKDVKNGQCHRADKLIEEHIQKVIGKKKNMKPEEREKLNKIAIDCDNYDAAQLNQCITENKIKAPDTGNDLSEAVPFNLMFATDIGPTGHLKGFLRPETAQGIFVNFRRLIEFNNGRMPFAGAQIGLAFRNEIHPKQGLLRVREFQMAEIEHFVDPLNKTHHKFFMVEDDVLPLLTADSQEDKADMIFDLTLKDAVAKGTINNETIAYFMARTFKFLKAVGIKAEAIRFRQHRGNEMAHYARDCWDAEVHCSYGWIEVAGHSDRSCFDLTRHAEKSKVELNAARPLKEPKKVQFVQVTLDKQKIGKTFKKDSKALCEYLENMKEEQKEAHLKEMEANSKIVVNANDKDIELPSDFLKFERQEKTVLEEKFSPHVIEPSFGLGRIVYCALEHCFKVREKDAQRTYLDFPALIAPVKCSLLPLMSQPALNKKVLEIKSLLTRAGLSSKVDDSGQTVGKRYARTDECGIPYAFTVDFQTLEDNTVTMRELDTMKQIRLPASEAPGVLNSLVLGHTKWAEMCDKYGVVTAEAKE